MFHNFQTEILRRKQSAPSLINKSIQELNCESHYNRREPKVNSNPYTYIFKNYLRLIHYILYICIFYIVILEENSDNKQ
jgi:hypothetical protein